jgi:acetyl-CoA acetyltransferase
VKCSGVCVSSDQLLSAHSAATMFAAQSIQLGINDIVVAGGMESMSNAPKYIAEARYAKYCLDTSSGAGALPKHILSYFTYRSCLLI